MGGKIRVGTALAVGLGAAVLSPTALAAPAKPAMPTADCAPTQPNGFPFITDQCRDPRYNQPVIDVDEWRDQPMRHRYVDGHFEGTGGRFAFYFPPPEQYKGWFIQGPTHHSQSNENLNPATVAFALASGAYAVHTNQGGPDASRGLEGVLNKVDPAISAYRVNAAGAQFSRIVAMQMYGPRRPFGYLHGGSGGAYQTMSGLDHTSIWDGGVPFVAPIPTSGTILGQRLHAARVLRRRDKFPCIMDALDPGGSGDPYKSCDLNAEEAAALKEASLLGFPLRGFYGHALLGDWARVAEAGDNTSFVASMPFIMAQDKTYFADFWTKPGYLGFDDPSLKAARVSHETTVAGVTAGAKPTITFTAVPKADLMMADLIVLSGAAAGKKIPLGVFTGNTATWEITANKADIAAVAAGDRVRIDNSDGLALQTYHRHQVPPEGSIGYDQYRGPDGKAIPPQRSILVKPAVGTGIRGNLHGKVIVLQGMMDVNAFPNQPDWYQKEIKRTLGQAAFANNYRIYYIDHAQHSGTGPTSLVGKARTVPYTGALQQALRDLNAWVQHGVKPTSTVYRIVDGQIVVPAKAAARKGIQPAVDLKANGSIRAEVTVGQPVLFTATIEVPPNTGKVVAAEWDFEGVGTYPVQAQVGKAAPKVTLTATHTFTKPGTYFPVVRATSQREGDMQTPYARVQNIGRARVVVGEGPQQPKSFDPANSDH